MLTWFRATQIVPALLEAVNDAHQKVSAASLQVIVALFTLAADDAAVDAIEFAHAGVTHISDLLAPTLDKVRLPSPLFRTTKHQKHFWFQKYGVRISLIFVV